MTVRSITQGVPRRLIDKTFDIGRLPISLVARATGQADNPHWPPLLAADLVESYVETWAGLLIQDSSLADQGAARRAGIEQLRRASRLDSAAAEVRRGADEKLANEQAQASQERARTAQASQQSKAEIARQTEARKRKSRAAAAKKTTVIRNDEGDQQQQIESVRRAGTKAALNAERRALEITREALDADQTVDVIDAAIDATAAHRADDE